VNVPGISSDQPRHTPAGGARNGAEGSVRQRVWVSNMYATPWRKTDGIASGDLQHYLRLWRFGHYYKLSADQLPGVLCPEALDVSTLKFQRWSHCARVTGARIWLFSLPSGQLVTSLSLDAQCELIDTVDLLEDCYFGDIEIGDQSLAEYAHAFAVQLGADSAAQATTPEGHSCP
jgi:hypothetical protein